MLHLIRNWFNRYVNDPELSILWLFLIALIVSFSFFGGILAPVLVSMVLAYLLQWPINALVLVKVPRTLAVLVVYLSFLSLVIIGLVVWLPLLSRQVSNLIAELPHMAARVQTALTQLPMRYPSYISDIQIQQLTLEFKSYLTDFGQWVVSFSVSLIPNIIAVAVYFVLVPILLYFLLMDQQKILKWFTRYLPQRRRLITQVWNEVYAQTGNYVRGRVLEILIVWTITFSVFSLLGLTYAMLLSVLVGLSTIIPYIGAVLVTIPVMIIAFLQWGWSHEFAYLVATYSLIIALDANLLVPFLFSEAVDLHPVAIIVAILFFGGLLGFWGVFFAIPLASVVKAILTAITRKPN